MATEFVRPNETEPVINANVSTSQAKGYESIAKTLGGIAERGMQKATEYASEASKANMLQTHSMIQDVESKSKLEMLRSPRQSELIAKNAATTIDQIKSGAKLNRGDFSNLDYFAKNSARSLMFSAAEKTISLARADAKQNALSALGDTLQSVGTDIFKNPEQADKLIEAQYEAIAGYVASDVLTAHEADVIHKQFAAKLQMAHELSQGIREGVLDAQDVNTWHAASTANVPLSNDGLPISHETAMGSNHYFGHYDVSALESKLANGQHVNSMDLSSLKNVSEIDKVMNFGSGAVRASGEIQAATNWVELEHKMDVLTKKENLTSFERGYKARLKNFFATAKEPGAYLNFVMSTPEGARMHNNYVEQQSVIDAWVPTGDKHDVAQAKYERTVDNLNDYITKSASLGLGMNYPDHLRQPIPLQIANAIQGAFNKDGDIGGAVANLNMLTPENRVYAMNLFGEDYRKQMTVYEVSNLSGQDDNGFRVTLMASQQDNALEGGDKSISAQTKYLQLDTSKEGYSDKRIVSRVMPEIGEVSTYLRYQPNGGSVVSDKSDQALRYIKKVASDNNDYKFANMNDYVKTYADNMNRAYDVKTGYNYVVSGHDLPLNDNEIPVMASHSMNVVRNKMLQYMSPVEVDNYFSTNAPILVSSPGGRLTVVDFAGRAIPDKYGQPAFSEVYTNSVWAHAEADKEALPQEQKSTHGFYGPLYSSVSYLRGKSNQDVLRPVVEGNIDLDRLPKVWNKDASYSTVKSATISEDGKTILIPTIVRGKEVGIKDAIAHYHRTGEHLGVFENEKDAEAYDKDLHRRMKWRGDSNRKEG